jgi:hypothetical protein
MSKTPAKTLKHAISNKTLNPFGAPAGGNPMVDNLTLFSAEEYARRGATGQFARIVRLLTFLLTLSFRAAITNWKSLFSSEARVMREIAF